MLLYALKTIHEIKFISKETKQEIDTKQVAKDFAQLFNKEYDEQFWEWAGEKILDNIPHFCYSIIDEILTIPDIIELIKFICDDDFADSNGIEIKDTASAICVSNFIENSKDINKLAWYIDAHYDMKVYYMYFSHTYNCLRRPHKSEEDE